MNDFEIDELASAYLDDAVSAVVEKLKAKGIDKFIAYEIPVEMAAARYGGHFEVVRRDVHETDDLRVLDFNGHQIMTNFALAELGEPLKIEG